jgi:hypothetical protein
MFETLTRPEYEVLLRHDFTTFAGRRFYELESRLSSMRRCARRCATWQGSASVRTISPESSGAHPRPCASSDDGGRTYRQILVQEYNFSPRGATFQREDQRIDLRQVTHLRLTVVPNKSGSGPATLTALRLFA